MDEEEDDSQDETDAAHHDVGNTKERVLPTQKTGGGQNYFLGPGELMNPVVVHNLELILLVSRKSFGKILVRLVVDFPVELSEVGQSSRSHPDYQVLV